jgi:hypothetical protein
LLSGYYHEDLGPVASFWRQQRPKSNEIRHVFGIYSSVDQAFAKKCCAAIFVLKVSQNLRRQIELLYGIFGYVIGQNIAKHKKG